MATPYPSIDFSQSSNFDIDQRINEARFGDGYSQRSADGLNSKFYKMRLMHENITTTQLNTLRTFWQTQGKVLPFDVTIPYSGEVVRCRFVSPLSISAMAGNIFNVSVDVEQDFGLTT